MTLPAFRNGWIILGEPTSVKASIWFYRRQENRTEGGHYLSATLSFDGKKLSDVKVGFGHETIAERKEE